MKIEIEISEEDYKEIYNTKFTIDEMDNTLLGRLFYEICRPTQKQNSVNQ